MKPLDLGVGASAHDEQIAVLLARMRHACGSVAGAPMQRAIGAERNNNAHCLLRLAAA
jgi:hypothetical protein